MYGIIKWVSHSSTRVIIYYLCFTSYRSWFILTWFEIMHIKDIKSLCNKLELNGKKIRRLWKTHHFYKVCRHIFESQIPRRPARVKNPLNRPLRYTSVRRPDFCGQQRRNVIIPSKQTLELSNGSNDENITDHKS